MRQVIGAMCLAMLLAACTPQVRDYGYVPTESDLAEIVVGVDSRDSVAEAIGYPAARGMTFDEAWIYIASRQVTIGFKAPKTTEREIVVVTFDAEGTVENIERFGLEDGRIIVLNRRVTTPNTKGISFLRQALGNLGRFTSDQVTGNSGNDNNN